MRIGLRTKMNTKTFGAGLQHSIFLTQDHSVIVCGNSKVLDGRQMCIQEITLPSNICSVYAGNEGSILLDSIGDVWRIGSAYNLPKCEGNEKITEPKKLANLPPMQSVAASLNGFTLFLDVDGYVWSCGDNSYGQLGLGNYTDMSAAQKIGNIPKIASISAGFYHSLLLDERGAVWGCGYNAYGQLGLNKTDNILHPTQLDSPVPITSVSAGDFHSFFIDESESLWACGRNLMGQLGVGSDTDAFKPLKVNINERVVNVSAGTSSTVFLDANWNVWACGMAKGLRIRSSTPVMNDTLSNIRDLSCSSHYLFLDASANIWVSGKNSVGQLGVTKNRALIETPEISKNLPPIASADNRFGSTKSARKL